MAASAAVFLGAASSMDPAAADGDTRTLTFFHTHTRETATVTFRRNGDYDERGLEQLNWLLRDWRVERQTRMDPRLFDILWEVYRAAGSTQPIQVVSAYRSPETNSALRQRSSGVSEHSQHMQGKAMDVRLPDVDTARLRAVAMQLQYGGVGYYASSQFVHVDTGSVRAWPRMTQDQLARLFPDGKTLHLPSNGKPLAGYEEAKAEILNRNTALAVSASAGSGPSLGSALASLFGRRSPEPAPAPQAPTQAAPVQTASAGAAPLQLASLDPASVVPEALSMMPLPPRRPKDLSRSLPVDSPVAAAGPTVVASVEPMPSVAEDRPRLEVLLDPVKSVFAPYDLNLDLSFSDRPAQDLSVTRFTGPAVKPLPVLRRVQASL